VRPGLRSLGEIVNAPYRGRPEKGWIVWWHGRTHEVCQAVLRAQHLDEMRRRSLVDDVVRIG
jgi:hypothetical protein